MARGRRDGVRGEGSKCIDRIHWTRDHVFGGKDGSEWRASPGNTRLREGEKNEREKKEKKGKDILGKEGKAKKRKERK